MLRHAKELERYELRARDGIVGHVDDFLFDDRTWTIRYLVAATGTWLDRRAVLISPASVSRTEWDQRLLSVNLTREQVRESPPVDPGLPVSREQEIALAQYYLWPSYWTGTGLADPGFALPILPLVPPPTPREAADPTASISIALQEDHHVHGVRAVTGHTIEATDGAIGHVDDFLIDDRSWEIRYLLIDTRNWWPGKKVVIAPQWIRAVGWDEARVQLDLTRTAIQTSPAYDPSAPITPDYAGQLQRHYRPPPSAV